MYRQPILVLTFVRHARGTIDTGTDPPQNSFLLARPALKSKITLQGGVRAAGAWGAYLAPLRVFVLSRTARGTTNMVPRVLGGGFTPAVHRLVSVCVAGKIEVNPLDQRRRAGLVELRHLETLNREKGGTNK